MNNGNKVIFNTGIIYGKMIITIIVSLVSTRWVLQALGNEDYGIYSLVGGVIAMFSFLNAALSSATQRFLSYEIGKGNIKSIKEIFYASFILHLICGIILAMIFQIGGFLLINHFLIIPEGKYDLAYYVLNTLSISTFFVIISVPYQSVMNAHENMIIISVVDILQALLKLALAWFLLSYNGNTLKTYAFTIMLINILGLALSFLYCYKNYKETHFRWHKMEDYTFFKSIGSYLGWLLFGFVCSLGRTQCIPIALNSMWGIVMNTAYGIANQVDSQVSFFSKSILRAIRPQIIQSEGQGDHLRMIRLSFTASKFSFICLSFFAIPLLLNINYVLGLWLGKVPEYTANFIILLLLISLINQLGAGPFLANESKGNIRNYQLTTGIIDLIVLPIGYYVMYIYNNPYGILIVVLFFICLSLYICLLITNRNLQIKKNLFFKTVILPLCTILIPSIGITYMIHTTLNEHFLRLCIDVISYIISSVGIMYCWGLTQEEKNVINGLINKFKRKL